MKNFEYVIITGITGFIGRKLAERFIDNGYVVFAIVRASSKIDKLSIKLQENVKFYVLDNDNSIRDVIKEIVSGVSSEIVVYHLASMVLAGSHKYEEIAPIINSNITFGVKLIDAMVENGIRNFVNTGTSWQHYNNLIYSPVNLYAASKQAFEDMVQYYIDIGVIDMINLQLFDTYGPDDTRKKIWNMLKVAISSDNLIKMTLGNQLIDLVYIDDVIDAYVLSGKYLISNNKKYCGTYAISSGKPKKLRDIVEMMNKISNGKIEVMYGFFPYRMREIMVPWSKGLQLPGWKPRISLVEGMKKFLYG